MGGFGVLVNLEKRIMGGTEPIAVDGRRYLQPPPVIRSHHL